jgi:hypothetical protein
MNTAVDVDKLAALRALRRRFGEVKLVEVIDQAGKLATVWPARSPMRGGLVFSGLDRTVLISAWRQAQAGVGKPSGRRTRPACG